MMTDRAPFFFSIRQSLFKGRLSKKQVEGLNFLLDEGEKWPKELVAYVLATAYHETAHTMQPIEEYGKGRGRAYGVMENGHVYYGRGYVQLTWHRNYVRAARELGLPFDTKPELALVPAYAAKILYLGCVQGWFTKYKLGDFINASQRDYVGARRVINGTDRAVLIAGYAEAFLEALEAEVSFDPKPTTGKPMVKSKTAWGSAFAGSVAAVNAFSEPLKQLQDSVASLGEICTAAAKNPFMWLSIAAIGVSIYLIMERKRHADENGV